MKPEEKSKRLLAITRSKAKMFEYDIPLEQHIDIPRDPANLFPLAIGLLGDFAAITSKEAPIIEDQGKQEHLLFAAHFFNSYFETRLDEEIDPYLLLLGSASYYLCGLPGSSLVFSNKIGDVCPNLDCLGLEDLLLWLLQGNWVQEPIELESVYAIPIKKISTLFIDYLRSGSGEEELLSAISGFRKGIYEDGSARQLLLADIICAMIKKHIANSTWFCLPIYSDLSARRWAPAIKKKTFVYELWPAQHLLGKQGVFRGESAIVQMPTSAGKTRAIEIIIRSAFLAKRTSLAVIVAPFRALCHEIRNNLIKAFRGESVYVDELSDVLQTDFEVTGLEKDHHIIVVTPEKLTYVLRHAPELTTAIGLLIYDEGHQFDSQARGITYELLLTSLKTMVSEHAQRILFSAVISNAKSIGQWLIGDESEIISGTALTPTYRTVAFASWKDRLGRLEFVDQDEPDQEEFFVPRVIEKHKLQLKERERKERYFPDNKDSQTIALFLGLKLASKGSIAIFCGQKASVSNICEKALDSYERGVTITKPIEYSNKLEMEALYFLSKCNLGEEAVATRATALGILSHHSNIPHGMRLAIEHAMKEGHAKFVICTSTLAQGVNLPIRYLIITNIYYGADRITVRDFHNLLGRAGRAGMHTEGSILFADPSIYDERFQQRWRWKVIKELLKPGNSEPCSSAILSLFEPFYSDNKKRTFYLKPLKFVSMYISDPEELSSFAHIIGERFKANGFSESGIEEQIRWRTNIVSSIESYLMSQWDEYENGLQEEDTLRLAQDTLAFFLANDEQKDSIENIFKMLGDGIIHHISEPARRKLFSKTLYGVWTSIEIENWVNEHAAELMACDVCEELLLSLWPLMTNNIRNAKFRKCDKPDVLKDLALSWIQGETFDALYRILKISGARLMAGKHSREYQIDHMVDICENAFAYDGTLVVGAVTELLGLITVEKSTELSLLLQELQKRLKYGLPSSLAISLYEMGFADRVVSIDLENILAPCWPDRNEVRNVLKMKRKAAEDCLRKYPAYYSERLRRLL